MPKTKFVSRTLLGVVASVVAIDVADAIDIFNPSLVFYLQVIFGGSVAVVAALFARHRAYMNRAVAEIKQIAADAADAANSITVAHQETFMHGYVLGQQHEKTRQETGGSLVHLPTAYAVGSDMPMPPRQRGRQRVPQPPTPRR